METQSDRLLSVDILRGLTIIFMIIVNDPGSWSHVYAPLLHAEWNGITPIQIGKQKLIKFIKSLSLDLELK